MAGPAISVEVLLSEIISNQQGTRSDIAGMRAEVTRAITRLEVMDLRNKNADDLHRDFEARIRLLERFRYTVAGVSLIGGFLAGFLGYIVGHAVH